MNAFDVMEDDTLIKTIDNQTFDTDSAELVARKSSGWYGDPYGFEELLFRKGQEAFFLFGQGGSSSIYHEPAIVPLSLEEAREWLNGVVGPDVSWQICEPVVIWNEEATRRAAKAPVKGKAKAASSRTAKAGTAKSVRASGKSAKPTGKDQPDREPVLAGTHTEG